jgi:hypothetical protein
LHGKLNFFDAVRFPAKSAVQDPVWESVYASAEADFTPFEVFRVSRYIEIVPVRMTGAHED